MNDAERQVLTAAMTKFGFRSNYGILVEECGELLSAMNKLYRGRVDEDAVITELADVSLAVGTFALYFGHDKFVAERERKLERLKKRVEESENL